MAEIKHAYLDGAKVQAFREPVLSFVGGVVFDDPGNPTVAHLRHSRYWKPVDSAVADASYDEHLSGKYIYGGPIYHHFGHFVAEMMHRIVPGRALQPEWPLLFVAPLGRPGSKIEIPPYITAVLEFFGLEGDHVKIVNRDCRVDELLVVESGSDFGGGPKPGYTDLLAQFTPRRLAELAPDIRGHDRIYVSRSKIRHGGSYLGETYLERWLATAGFETVFPEELPYVQQVKTYAGASTIVFSEGSACHGAEVLGSGAFENCVLIGRRQNHLHIFEGILRARSKRFKGGICGPDLGTAVGRTGSRDPLPNFGVSLLDPEQVVSLLEAAGALPTVPFDASAYLEEAERDLDCYLSYHAQKPSVLYEPFFAEQTKDEFAISAQKFRIIK